MRKIKTAATLQREPAAAARRRPPPLNATAAVKRYPFASRRRAAAHQH